MCINVLAELHRWQLQTQHKHKYTTIQALYVQGNNAARSCKHCWSAKAIKYSVFWMCVYSHCYPAHKAQALCCHLWPVLLYRVYPPYHTKGTICGGKCYWAQYVCFGFYTNFVWKNYYLEKNSATYCNKFKVAGSIPDSIIETFQSHNPSGCTMALGSTQPLTEMSTRSIFKGVKAARSSSWQPYDLHETNVLKFWNYYPPGTLRICPGLYMGFFNVIVYRHKCTWTLM